MESEHDWPSAARLYSQILKLVPQNNLSELSVLQERSAYALFKAAMQAQSEVQFEARIRQGIENYARSAETRRSSDRLGQALAVRNLAMIRYLDFWLTRGVTKKLELLEDCWRLTKDALNSLEELNEKEEYVATYNNLSWAPMFAASLDWKLPTRRMKIMEAIELGEKSVAFLDPKGHEIEMAGAASKVSAFLEAYSYYLAEESVERAAYHRKALSYWDKARKLEERTAIIENVTFAIFPCTTAGMKLGSQETLQLLEDILGSASLTRDQLIIGSLQDLLSFNYSWASYEAEDPGERLRLGEIAIRHYREARSRFEPIDYPITLQDPEPRHYMNLADLESDPMNKRGLLDKAVEASRKELIYNNRHEHPAAMYFAHYSFGASVSTLARVEHSPSEKKKLLEDGLGHWAEALRITEEFLPYSYYEQGMLRNNIATIRGELASIAEDPEAGADLLRNALANLEAGLALCGKSMPIYERSGPKGVFATYGKFQIEQGDLLVQLFETSGEDQIAKKAVKAFENGMESFQRLNRPTMVAECLWKTAKVQVQLGNHLEAARSFHLACNNYEAAANLVSQSSRFYLDLAHYMEAWSNVETARQYHERQEYRLARESYDKATELLKSTVRWNHLESYYSALSTIELAEDLSRKYEVQRGIEVFTHGASLFAKANDLLNQVLCATENEQEAKVISDLIIAAGIRREYCNARIRVEQATQFLRQGNSHASGEKYGEAAALFEEIVQRTTSKHDQKEFGLGATVSRAWQMIAKAQGEASPSLYLEASRLFDEAKELSPNESTRMLMLGNSWFCKALEASTRYLDSEDRSGYTSIMKDLDTASRYYRNAGFQSESDYAEGTELLFEGYSHSETARRESDQEKKAKLLSMAEKLLTLSADSYLRAGYKAKRDQVLGLIGKVRKERKLAISLQEILRASPKLPASAAFTASTASLEKPSGLENLESANVVGTLKPPEGSISTGATLSLDIELVNIGKGTASLVKLDPTVSEGLEFQGPTADFDNKIGGIDLRGKKLEHLNTFQVKIQLKPVRDGTFTISPTTWFTDEKGTYRSHKIEGVSLTVGTPIREQTSPVMAFLGSAFVEDYMAKRLTAEYAGWRTLMDIVETLQIPKAQVYGDARYGHTFGRSLEDLVKRGLVEYRIVPGVRGRGGNVMKVRVAYDREPVKKMVNELALRPTKRREVEPMKTT